jgi:dTDP-4-dehydrorhamnose 3,5-epimerase
VFSEKNVSGVWLFEPRLFLDSRGSFYEAFKQSAVLNETGIAFDVLQVNQSTSKKGVIRGVHVTAGATGQAKYVSCVNGAVLDIVVDLRLGSRDFGKWDCEVLTAENKKVMIIPRGIGHAFISLEDDSTVNYLCSAEFDPVLDETYNIFDPLFAINLERIRNQYSITEFILSEKDLNAKFIVT